MLQIEFKFLEEQYNVEIEKSHYMRRLGFPKNYEIPDHIQDSMDWSSSWYAEKGNPWLQIFELEINLENEQLFLNKKETFSPKIYKRFNKYGVEKAMLIATTAGDKVDKESKILWSSDYPDRAFFLETYASCVTESLVEFAVDQIKYWANKKQQNALSRYSPGYPGWDLKEQNLLMQIIESISKIPISISETSLLIPLKSQLSLVGIHQGEQKEKNIKIECMQCTFNNCTCRNKEMYIKINQ